MSNFKTLYLANDPVFDMSVYKKAIPFWKAKCSYESKSLSDETHFEEYDALTDNCKRIFRDLVYEQCSDLHCTKDEFLQLYKFLDFVGFNKVEFLPLYRRFIYSNRDDKEFLKATAFIHRIKEWLRVEWKELYCIILGIDKDSSLEDIKTLADTGNSDVIDLYALCLHHGIGGEKDQKKAREIYLKNWEDNRHSNSLHNYALCLHEGIGGEKDVKKARELYLKNWEENKNSDSLHNYAYCLQHGIGGERDEKKARELYLKNWEENRNSDSLYRYAVCLESGIGGEKDVKKARELYGKNWDENRHSKCLYSYAICLEKEYRWRKG